MEYKTVFDITHNLPNLWFGAAGLIFVVAGAICVFQPEPLKLLFQATNKEPPGRTVGFIILGFGLLWTIGSSWLIYSQYSNLRTALEQGRVSIVEGRVRDFRPMPPEGHQSERFTVQGHTFAYSDYVVTPGFHNTTSHGGPIHEGLYVRINYVGNDIARLEVKE